MVGKMVGFERRLKDQTRKEKDVVLRGQNLNFFGSKCLRCVRLWIDVSTVLAFARLLIQGKWPKKSETATNFSVIDPAPDYLSFIEAKRGSLRRNEEHQHKFTCRSYLQLPTRS